MARKRCPNIPKAYAAAKRADGAFQRELVRVYGARRAGDARYKPDSSYTDARLKRAVRRFKKASDVLHKAYVCRRGGR